VQHCLLRHCAAGAALLDAGAVLFVAAAGAALFSAS
jgi:hypothetical protein